MIDIRYIDPFSYPDTLDDELASAISEAEILYLQSSKKIASIAAIKPVDGKICFYFTHFGDIEILPKTWRGFDCIYKPASSI